VIELYITRQLLFCEPSLMSSARQ